MRVPLMVSGCTWIQEKVEESQAMFLCLFCKVFSNVQSTLLDFHLNLYLRRVEWIRMLHQSFQCALSRSAGIQIKDEQIKRKRAFEQAIKDLGDSFAISTLKAAEGRAQRRVSDKDIMQSIVSMAVQVVNKSKDDMIFDFADDEDVTSAASILAPALYVVAGGHVSSAKYELQELGCLRFVLSGGRTIVLLDASAIKRYADLKTPDGSSEFSAAEAWSNSASQEALQEFVEKGGKNYTATTGPMDVLYMPAGGFASIRFSRQRTTFAFGLGRRQTMTSPYSRRSGRTSVHAGRIHLSKTQFSAS